MSRSSLRVLLYCQHLSGAGHFVRTHEIARALATVHDVRLVHGGWPVPRAPIEGSFEEVHLPGLVRRDGRIVGLEPGASVDDVIAARRLRLIDLADDLRPTVLVLEHFPFSKWELEEEILGLVARVRRASPRALVLCSLRDVAPFGAREMAQAGREERARGLLLKHFDGVLVHADREFLRVSDQLPWLERVDLPLHYTGYVSEKPPPADGAVREGWVASTGGLHGRHLRDAVLEAWERLRSGTSLRMFGARQGGALPAPCDGVRFEEFSPEFLAALGRAELSISQAGYNTCTNLLATRTRAVLVPAASMRDQRVRAAQMAELGLAEVVEPERLDVTALEAAIGRALAAPPPEHRVDLDGAASTRRVIEAMVR